MQEKSVFCETELQGEEGKGRLCPVRGSTVQWPWKCLNKHCKRRRGGGGCGRDKEMNQQIEPEGWKRQSNRL